MARMAGKANLRTVWVCFEAHRPDGLVWAVRYGNQWVETRQVWTTIPLATVYRGVKAPQPKAYLRGAGIVRGDAELVTITAT